MLTSKQRSYLRGLANGLDSIFQVGKNGVTPELRETVHLALEARELIKINVLDNTTLETAEAAELLASRTGADVVQVIGKRFILYRKSKTKPVIELPRAKKS
ncbi:MAG: ribosome assembly RNA-binding protein YhbY [Bacillota bacterium]